MAGGKVHHWKHGWIPVDYYATLIKQGKSPAEARRIAYGNKNPTKRPNTKQEPFSTVMAMSQPGHGPDDPLSAKEEDNPFLLGSLGFSFMPDYKGQSFTEWRKLHERQFMQSRQAWEKYQDGKGPLPKAHPLIFPAQGATPELKKAIDEDGGFTYDPRTGGLLEAGKAAGYAVAIPGTETVIGREKVNGEDFTRDDLAAGIAQVIKNRPDLFEQGAVIGGWYSPDRNEYMVEISQIFSPHDREGAIQAGRDRNQEGVFNLATGELIVTGGSGDSPDLEPDREALNILTEEMTPEERAAAKFYTGPGYKPLNAAARSGTAPKPQTAFYEQMLDRLLSNSRTKKDLTVYRGIKSGPWIPDHIAPGSTYSDPGYMSTAVAAGPPENYTGDITFVIRVPQGSNALDLNAYALSHHPEERELLLPRGSQFRVIADQSGSDGRTIEMELTQNEQSQAAIG